MAEAESLAAASGIARLYLLTDTAEAWFTRLGYEPATRDAAPVEIAASPEFTGACSESAVMLTKRLRDEAAAT